MNQTKKVMIQMRVSSMIDSTLGDWNRIAQLPLEQRDLEHKRCSELVMTKMKRLADDFQITLQEVCDFLQAALEDRKSE